MPQYPPPPLIDFWCREAVQKFQSKVKEVNYNTDRPPNYRERSLTELPLESLIDRI
jgi:hypothetical protein